MTTWRGLPVVGILFLGIAGSASAQQPSGAVDLSYKPRAELSVQASSLYTVSNRYVQGTQTPITEQSIGSSGASGGPSPAHDVQSGSDGQSDDQAMGLGTASASIDPSGLKRRNGASAQSAAGTSDPVAGTSSSGNNILGATSSTDTGSTVQRESSQMLADQGSSQVEDSQHLPLEKTMQAESGQGSAALGSSGTSPTVSTLTAASQISTSSSVAGGGGAKSAGAAVQQTAATSTSARFGNAKYSKSGTPGAEDRRGKSDSAMSSAFSASASSRSAHGEASGVAGSKATASSFRSTLGSSSTSSSLKSLRSGPGSPMMGGTMGGLGQLARGTGSGSSPAFHGGFSKNVGSRHSTAAYGFSPSSSSSKQLSWRAPHSNSQHSAVYSMSGLRSHGSLSGSSDQSRR